jgi:hypothetical protein
VEVSKCPIEFTGNGRIKVAGVAISQPLIISSFQSCDFINACQKAKLSQSLGLISITDQTFNEVFFVISYAAHHHNLVEDRRVTSLASLVLNQSAATCPAYPQVILKGLIVSAVDFFLRLSCSKVITVSFLVVSCTACAFSAFIDNAVSHVRSNVFKFIIYKEKYKKFLLTCRIYVIHKTLYFSIHVNILVLSENSNRHTPIFFS